MDDLNSSKLLKASEVAEILGCSGTNVYRLLQSEIPVVRFGGSVRVRKSDLDEYLEKKTDKHQVDDQK